MPFFGRNAELNELDRLYEREGATFGVVYGRRRVGKTALLTHWLKTRKESESGMRAFLWFAEVGTPQEQLRKFCHALMDFLDRPRVVYADWGSALQAVADASEEDQKLVVVIDEFTYLLAEDRSISSQFQKAWDLVLSKKNLMLVLAGSYMGMMHSHVISAQGPLFGRTNSAIYLQPFGFAYTSGYFPGYSADTRVNLYSIWGGIPGYWNRLDPGVSLSKNLVTQLLTPNSPYHFEPRLLLVDHVQDPSRYVSILRAISHGLATVKEIHTATGIAQSSLPPYLQVMQEARIITRRIPVTAKPSSKSGRYFVIDPFLRFYYRFIEPHRAEIEMGLREQALADIEQHLARFIGANTWEEICRVWVAQAGARGRFDALPGNVGSVWNRQAQIDVAAINTTKNTMILGECKWTGKPEGRTVIQKLVEQAGKIIPGERAHSVTLIGFSRHGWASGAEEESKEILEYSGKNWSVAEILLLDLETVDNDLSTWASDDHFTEWNALD
jgi:AAA+ ATPase superfamily predicted ATPase